MHKGAGVSSLQALRPTAKIILPCAPARIRFAPNCTFTEQPPRTTSQNHRTEQGKASGFSSKYAWGELLGQGAFGVVRVATHTISGQQYAVKQLAPSSTNWQRRAIEREVAIWSSLQACPNIAKLEEVIVEDNHTYLIQELCHGGDLQTQLEVSGPFSEKEAAQAIWGVLSAIAECHAHGIYHGDVKPANFLLRHMYPTIWHILDPSVDKGEIVVKATDFGCSRQCTQNSCGLNECSGTLLYSAPEVLNRDYGLASDVWSVGIMLYQLLSGRYPFWDLDIEYLDALPVDVIRESIREACVLYPDDPWDNVSLEAKDLINCLLTHNPADRLTAQQALQHRWFEVALKPSP